jgi:glutamine synthetase
MTEALRLAREDNVSLVRFLYADHGGIIRGKAAARSRFDERIESGIGHTRAMMAMSMMDELQPVEGMGPVGEVRIKPDANTFVTLPYAFGVAAMLSDQVNPDGTPWDGCARTFLKQAITELATEGYELQAAFEPEFTLGRREGTDLVPVDESLCYSATGFHLAHDYIIDLVEALNKQGLEVEHYYPELGHGQQEVSIRHATALRAADNQVLVRETARAVAIRHGLWASFAPKPLPDQAGNGAHLHAFLWSGGENAFADPSCYGPDNREAAVRICSPVGASGSVNLELKPSDSSGNPYLALGGFIYAGLDGMRRELDPGEPLSVDPATLSASERSRLSVARLPASLPEALDALQADPVLMSALGPLRSTAYLAVKRSEAAHFEERDAAYECYQHFMKL